ncbi:DNA repair exonuclease [Planctomycetes bacterium Poly30]
MTSASAPTSFRFLHAADLHLDSPLRGLSTYPGAPADRLRQATRDAFAALVDAALIHEVRFVLLAGDLFDGEWQDYNSGLWFLSQLRRLTTSGIRVFVIRGNHDAESKVASRLSWPDGVTEFKSKKAHTVLLEDLGVAIHGQSYREPHVMENLALGYPDAHPEFLNIGLLHSGLEGYEGHGTYAPCTLDDLRARGYDYWALGHIHQRQVVSEEPWVVFPGNIQGRHVRETGPKGATLVHVQEGAIERLEPITVDVARWAVLDVDLAGATSESEALLCLDRELRSAAQTAGDRQLAVRVVLGGATALDPLLRTETHRMTQEIRARAAAVSDDIWIEQLKIRTSLPPDATSGEASDDTLTAFAARLHHIELPADVLDGMARELQKLSVKLPPAVRERIDPASPNALRAALPEARDFLAALLRAGDDEAEAEEPA